MRRVAPPAACIGIIGGGFSGAVVAVQLARLARVPIAIEIIEPRPLLGGGVAYSAADPAHRINVPAARMTVFPEDPAQFDRWLRETDVLEHDPAALWTEELAFPQRSVFGRYIAELVAEAGQTPGVSIRHHQLRATDVVAHRRGFTIGTEDGARTLVDYVVVAVSHPPPSVTAMLRDVLAAGAPVIADPWRAGALDGIAPLADVLIVGTGLTMADVVATLDRRGHRGRILAVSRRGLLSRGHAFAPAGKWEFAEAVTPPATAAGLVKLIRDQVGAAATQGLPWQLVFDDVRLHARRLWTALPVAEQRRIVRHIRPYWDVHRFRVAPQIEASIGRMQTTGQFQSMAASLAGATWDGAKVAVQLRPRHAAGAPVITRTADALVITTGPAHTSAITGNPVLAALLRQGLVQADRAGLGLEVDASSHALGRDGSARDDLFISGPLARGKFGELMGLPQVSEHAALVAGGIVQSIQAAAENATVLGANAAE